MRQAVVRVLEAVSHKLLVAYSALGRQKQSDAAIKSMQPGQAFHVNYATSYELFKNVRLGFNGYWLQQLTNHEINGVAVPNSKERTVGLGPGIQFGGQGIWFRVNSYIETDVRNRPSGVKVTLRISKALPTAEPQP